MWRKRRMCVLRRRVRGSWHPGPQDRAGATCIPAKVRDHMGRVAPWPRKSRPVAHAPRLGCPAAGSRGRWALWWAYWSVDRLERDPDGRLCSMDFAFDDRTQDLRERLLGFMDEQVYP